MLTLTLALQAIHALWSFEFPGQLQTVSVDQETLLYTAYQGFGVLDLKTGKQRWKRDLQAPAFGSQAAFGANTVFVAVGKGDFRAIDSSSGRTLWTLPRKGYSGPVAYEDGTVYVELVDGRLSAIDVRKRKPRWESSVDTGKALDSSRDVGLADRPVRLGNVLVAVSHDGIVRGLDHRTGTLLWKRSTGALRHSASVVEAGGRVVVTDDGGQILALDPVNGRLEWRAAAAGGLQLRPATDGQRVYVTTTRGRVEAFDLRTGARTMQVPIRAMDGDPHRLTSPTVIGGRITVGASDKLFSLSAEGRQNAISGIPVELFGEPPRRVGSDYILFEANRVHRFREGAPPPVANVLARVIAIISQSRINPVDLDELRRYGTTALDVILPIIVERAQEYERAIATKKPAFPVYTALTNAVEVATDLMHPGATDAALPIVLEASGKESESYLLPLLVKGDPEKVVPVFLEIYRRDLRELSDGLSSASFALGYLSQSKDERAIRFLRSSLLDETAPEGTRFAAFASVASAGDAESVDAVRQAMPTQRRLPPLTTRAGFEKIPVHLGDQVLAIRKDAKGKTWGLLRNRVLGSRDDLWIARAAGGRWVNPRFTGVNAGKPSGFVTGKHQSRDPNPAIRRLIKGGWFKAFVGNPGLERDRDGDGLTDLVEARLTLAPTKPDTDGDGIPDGVDSNPNTTPRRLSDSEQAIKAALAARYAMGIDEALALFTLPAGLKPIEVGGRENFVISRPAAKRHFDHPLARLYEQGIALISLRRREDADEMPKSSTPADQHVQWNENRTEATVTVSTYFGGLAGDGYEITVKKFGNDWLPIRMRMAWIS